MRHSEQLNELAAALVAFQAEVTMPGKDATNPHFRNRYTTLDALLMHVRAALAKHKLAHFQSTCTRESDGRTGVRTMILHASGQWIEGDAIYLKDRKDDAQGAGSCITYARRYSLLAALGLAPSDDDDGQAASTPPQAAAPRGADIDPDDEWRTAIAGADSLDALKALYGEMDAARRKRLQPALTARRKELGA